MKRLVCWLLCALTLCCGLFACAKTRTDEVGAVDPSATYTPADGRKFFLALDLTKYVDVTFSGLTVTDPTVTVDESDLDLQIRDAAKSLATSVSAVTANCTAMCSLVGTVDGTTVYSATDAQIDTGASQQTYPGLAEALVGIPTGIQTTLTVTAPADGEYAGRRIVYTVTVKYAFAYEISDSMIGTYTSGAYKTLAAYRQKLYDDAYEQNQKEARYQAVWSAITQNAKVLAYPTDAVEYYQSYYQPQGVAGSSLEQTARDACLANLCFYRIVQATGFYVSAGEYEAEMKDYISAYTEYMLLYRGETVDESAVREALGTESELLIGSVLETEITEYLLSHNTFRAE